MGGVANLVMPLAPSLVIASELSFPHAGANASVMI